MSLALCSVKNLIVCLPQDCEVQSGMVNKTVTSNITNRQQVYFHRIFYCHLFPYNMHIRRCHKYTTILIEYIIYNQFTFINIIYRFECILLVCAVRAGMR